MKHSPLIPLIVATIVLFLSMGLYAFGYYTLTTSTARLSKLTTEAGTKNFELERLSRSRAALASLSGDEAVIHQYSINKEDIVPFLENLQTTGKPFGAQVSVLSVSDDNGLPTHPRITLSVSIVGTFDAVMRTLGTIENGPFDGVLTNLTVDSSGSDTKGVKQWTAATVMSVGLRPIATTTQGKP